MNRMINFANGAEVWCPYRSGDIDITSAEGCLRGLESRCEYLSRIDVGTVACTWKQADGHDGK